MTLLCSDAIFRVVACITCGIEGNPVRETRHRYRSVFWEGSAYEFHVLRMTKPVAAAKVGGRGAERSLFARNAL